MKSSKHTLPLVIAILACLLAACIFGVSTPTPLTSDSDVHDHDASSDTTDHSDVHCVLADAKVLCEKANSQCGTIETADSCGATHLIDCDFCGINEQCSENVCVCVSQSAAELCAGKDCGNVQVDDRCGIARNVYCGACTDGNQCGANPDLPNFCEACTPRTCEQLLLEGYECGLIPDGCGGFKSCTDPCPDTKACNALNKCTDEPCDPITECPADSCDNISDGCGNTLDCQADCTDLDVCENGRCVCISESHGEICDKANACGTQELTDRCGVKNMIGCGDCAHGSVCVSGECCLPETAEELCAKRSTMCGSISIQDRCGQTRNISSCGRCAVTFTCCNGRCATLCI